MTSASWFRDGAKVANTVTLINNLPGAKLNRLIARIISKIHLKDEKPFSEEEEEKLQIAFDMKESDVTNVIETISFIFEQALYHNAKPGILLQQLSSIELDDERCECFQSMWAENRLEVRELLRKQTFAPKQLDEVNWELHLQTASVNQMKLKEPVGLLELGITKGDTKKREKLLMEFTQEELFKFYEELEAIQKQLDVLNT